MKIPPNLLQPLKSQPHLILSTSRPKSLNLLPLFLAGFFFIVGCNPTPAPPAAKPEAAATPAPQSPPTDQEIAQSLAFPTTVIAVTKSTITFTDGDQKTKLTLPIDSATKFIGIQSLAEIQPNSTIGIRLSADKKRIFVLNSTL